MASMKRFLSRCKLVFVQDSLKVYKFIDRKDISNDNVEYKYVCVEMIELQIDQGHSVNTNNQITRLYPSELRTWTWGNSKQTLIVRLQ